VANKGLTGGHFRICGNDWSYGRFFGSVAMIGVSDILEQGRGRGRRGEKCRAAGAHGLSGAGYRQSRVRTAGTQYTKFLLFVKRYISRSERMP